MVCEEIYGGRYKIDRSANIGRIDKIGYDPVFKREAELFITASKSANNMVDRCSQTWETRSGGIKFT